MFNPSVLDADADSVDHLIQFSIRSRAALIVLPSDLLSVHDYKPLSFNL